MWGGGFVSSRGGGGGSGGVGIVPVGLWAGLGGGKILLMGVSNWVWVIIYVWTGGSEGGGWFFGSGGGGGWFFGSGGGGVA